MSQESILLGKMRESSNKLNKESAEWENNTLRSIKQVLRSTRIVSKVYGISGAKVIEDSFYREQVRSGLLLLGFAKTPEEAKDIFSTGALALDAIFGYIFNNDEYLSIEACLSARSRVLENFAGHETELGSFARHFIATTLFYLDRETTETKLNIKDALAPGFTRRGRQGDKLVADIEDPYAEEDFSNVLESMDLSLQQRIKRLGLSPKAQAILILLGEGLTTDEVKDKLLVTNEDITTTRKIALERYTAMSEANITLDADDIDDLEQQDCTQAGLQYKDKTTILEEFQEQIKDIPLDIIVQAYLLAFPSNLILADKTIYTIASNIGREWGYLYPEEQFFTYLRNQRTAEITYIKDLKAGFLKITAALSEAEVSIEETSFLNISEAIQQGECRWSEGRTRVAIPTSQTDIVKRIATIMTEKPEYLADLKPEQRELVTKALSLAEKQRVQSSDFADATYDQTSIRNQLSSLLLRLELAEQGEPLNRNHMIIRQSYLLLEQNPYLALRLSTEQYRVVKEAFALLQNGHYINNASLLTISPSAIKFLREVAKKLQEPLERDYTHPRSIEEILMLRAVKLGLKQIDVALRAEISKQRIDQIFDQNFDIHIGTIFQIVTKGLGISLNSQEGIVVLRDILDLYYRENKQSIGVEYTPLAPTAYPLKIVRYEISKTSMSFKEYIKFLHQKRNRLTSVEGSKTLRTIEKGNYKVSIKNLTEFIVKDLGFSPYSLQTLIAWMLAYDWWVKSESKEE